VESSTVKTLALIVVDLLMLLPLLHRRRWIYVSRANWWVLGAYMVICVHYAFFGYSISVSTNNILAFGAALFLLCIIIANGIGSDMAFRALSALLMVFATLFVSANVIALVVKGNALFEDGNFLGLTSNPNMLGGYLAILCVPALLQRTDARVVLIRLIVLATLSMTMLLIVLTRSRATFLTLFAILLHFMLTRDDTSKLQKAKALLITTLLAAGALIWIGSKYEETGLFSTRTAYLLQRTEAIAERPWTGWGFNSDVFSDRDVEQFPPMEKGNTVLAILEELGIPLGSLLMIAMSSQLWWTVGVLNRSRQRRTFAGIVIGSCVHLSFETWLFNFYSVLSILFWTSIVLANNARDAAAEPWRGFGAATQSPAT